MITRRSARKVDALRGFDMQAISVQDIVDTVREGLFVLNSDLIIASANHCFYGLFKTTPDETLGRRIGLPPEKRPSLK